MRDSLRREILDSRHKLEDLLKMGADTIVKIRDSGEIDAQVLGTFKTGVTDDITKPDVVLGNVYAQKTREYWPGAHCFIEDKPQPTGPFRNGDWAIFWDPVDATKLLIEDSKLLEEHGPRSEKRMRGYSSMAAIAVYEQGKGFNPVLGMFKEVEGPLVWAYHDGEESHLYMGTLKEGKTNEKLVLARPKADRNGFLNPATESLKAKLGCEVRNIRGMAPQAKAFIQRETDIILYEKGIALSDVYPLIPMIRVRGGEAFDWKGNTITYSGEEQFDKGLVIVNKNKIATEHGFVGVQEHVDRKGVLAVTSSAYK